MEKWSANRSRFTKTGNDGNGYLQVKRIGEMNTSQALDSNCSVPITVALGKCLAYQSQLGGRKNAQNEQERRRSSGRLY